MQVPVINGAQVQQSGPPAAYLNAQAAPVGQLLGEGITSVASALKSEAAKAKSMADRVAARNAITELQTASDNDFYGEGGYDRLSGKDLFEKASTQPQAFIERWQEIKSKLTPDQQYLADEDADPLLRRYRVSLSETLHSRTLEYWGDSYKARQESIRTAASADAFSKKFLLRPSITTTTHGKGRQPVDLFAPRVAEDLAALDKNAAEYVSEAPTAFGDPFTGLAALKEESHTAYHERNIRALLASGQDEVGQAYLRAYGQDIHDDVRATLTATAEAAFEVGETARTAGDILRRVPTVGADSERRKALHDEAKTFKDKLPKLDGVLDNALDEQIRVRREATADELQGYLEALDGGASATDIAVAAAGAPLHVRESVAKAISDRASGTVEQSQNALYMDLQFRATGWDPETGERSEAVRKEFLALGRDDLLAMQRFMRREDWNHLESMWKEGQAGGTKAYDALVTDNDIAMSVVNRLVPTMSNEEKERTNYAYETKRRLDALWKAEQGDGPPLTQEQKSKQADDLVSETVFDRAGVWGRGVSGQPGNLTVLEVLTADPHRLDIDDIDEEIVEALKKQLREAGLADPNDVDVIRAYQRQIQAGLIESLDE